MSSVAEQFFATLAFPVELTGACDALFASSQSLPDLVEKNTICALPYWAFFEVAGPDAAKFLQGQLTCDIANTAADKATLGAHCTPKGRMLSSFLIAQPAPEKYWLRVRRDIVANATAALGKYIVFSKAKIAAQEQLLAIGLHGPDAARAVAEFAGNKPAAQWGAVKTENGLIVQLDAAGQRFEAWLPQDEALKLWGACANFTAVNSTFWRWLDIRAGIVAIEAATADTFIPQMLNLHLNGGVSFNKGCYTGQEIVARAHYRGQIKRHLLRAEAATPAPAAGSDVVNAEGRVVGQVAAAVDRGDGHCELLLVASGDETTQAAMFIKNAAETAGDRALRVL